MDDSKEKIEISKETIDEFKRMFEGKSFALDDEFEYTSFDEFPNMKQLISNLKEQNPHIEEKTIYEAFRPVYDITTNFGEIDENKGKRSSWINKTFDNLIKRAYIDYKEIRQIKGIDDLIYQMMPEQVTEDEKKVIRDKFTSYFAVQEMKDLHALDSFVVESEDGNKKSIDNYTYLKKIKDNLKEKNPDVDDEQIDNVLESVYNITQNVMDGFEYAVSDWENLIEWKDNDSSYEAEHWKSYYKSTDKSYISEELNELLKKDYRDSIISGDVLDGKYFEEKHPEYVKDLKIAWLNKKIDEKVKSGEIEQLMSIEGASQILMQMMPEQLSEAEKSKIMHKFSNSYIKSSMKNLIGSRKNNEFKKVFDEEKYTKTLKLFLEDDEYSIQEMDDMGFVYDTILCFTDIYYVLKGDEYVGNRNDEPTFETVKAIFEKYTKQCTKPEDLLGDIPGRLFNLMNTNFLEEEQKQELKDIYEKNYKSRFEEKNNQRIEELKLKYPELQQKIENLEYLSGEELSAFVELISIDRANRGSFKEEYIDCLIKQC